VVGMSERASDSSSSSSSSSYFVVRSIWPPRASLDIIYVSHGSGRVKEREREREEGEGSGCWYVALESCPFSS
jgi:hypothetical protein